MVVSLLTAKPNKRMLYEFDHYMDDPLPGTLPSGTVLVDEPGIISPVESVRTVRTALRYSKPISRKRTSRG